MVVIVEPTVSLEKLQQLLAERHEGPCLDYKSACDLSETRDVVELAKDVAAMQVDGGYIVIGANDDGGVCGWHDTASHRALDEAVLRNKLARYFSSHYELRCAVHQVEGVPVGVIYVGVGEHGFCVCEHPGQYEVKHGSGRSQSKTAFAAGDVIVRRGTQSTRWEQTDVERIRKKVRVEIAEQVRAELSRQFAEQVKAVMVAGQSREVATGPVGSTDWRLAEPAFVGAVTELVRARDKVAIRMLFLDLERGLSSLPGLGEDQAVLLDRVTSLVCRLLLIGHARLAERLVDLLFMSFLGANLRAERSQADVATLVEIATRVMCVGALAVRRRNWAFVRSLTLRRDESGGMCYNNWLRQTVTSASRAGVFTRKGELVGLSHEYSMTHPGVAPDVPDDRDALLNSLCQYDLLWNLVAIAASTSSAKDSGDWYPSFGRYHSERSEPALLAVIGDQKMREQLGLGSDARLAGDLAELIETTAKEFFTGAWHGFMDRRVKAFIEAHHVPGQEAV